MRTLSKYSPWQSEMVVTASLLKLDLLSDNQIFEYTHYLLDNGYYGDAMLSIIDDDPIYPRGNKESFQRAIFNLGFPDINTEQAKWIYTYRLMNKYATAPNNHYVFANEAVGFYYKFDDFFNNDNHLKEISKLKDLLYCIEDASDNFYMGYITHGCNDPVTLYRMQCQFFQLCQQWIKDNKPKIECIFEALYA
ncbi:MAG: hypothetical protein ACTH5M_06195 [Psychrobacter sp.]|uniref:hypothetical protein n=1 Tax=Psychrobacter sp. AOP7-B1-24 TaxID=3457645 RepID=UPI003FB81C76